MNRDDIKTEAPALEEKARETVARYGMLSGRGAVLVGVSGGADSMALLKYLCNQREATGLKVYAAHVNHLLRGEEALRDECFVREWCAQNGVKLFVLSADVKAIAKESGETVEEAGRRVRYGFFSENAKKLSAAVATAHTLSDSIETLLFNLARGSGLRGLCGIPPVRGDVIRPLIRCTRRDTEEYCHYYGIEYVFDSTNFSHDYTRNRIRLDVVPQLYGLNPAFDRAAARLIDSLEGDEEYLSENARRLLESARRGEDGYSAELLAGGEPAVKSRAVAYAAADFCGTAQEAKHIAAVLEILASGAGKVQLKGGDFAEVRNGRLVFTLPAGKNAETVQIEEFSFPFEPGTLKNSRFELSILPISPANIKNFKNIGNRCFYNAIDCDKIKDNALVRAKKQGDRFSPAGRNVTKSLKKLFNEEKIPVAERALVPVVADVEGVVWVGGQGVCERCRVTEGTKNAVLLEIKRLEV